MKIQQISLGLLMSTACLLANYGWNSYPGKMRRVASGTNGIWALDNDNSIWMKTSRSWKQVSGSLKDISVGENSVWGVNRLDSPYTWSLSRGWKYVLGSLIQVSVSGVDDSVVWGVNSFHSVYRWSGLIWKRVHGSLVHVSCGEPGVWGLNSRNEVYYRMGTNGGINSAGSGWEKVEGSLVWISSGTRGEVWGVDYEHNVYRRDGILYDNPTGSKWSKVEGKLKQLDVFAGIVWGVDKEDRIWYRDVIDVTTTTTTTPTRTTTTVKTTAQSCQQGNERMCQCLDSGTICDTCEVDCRTDCNDLAKLGRKCYSALACQPLLLEVQCEPETPSLPEIPYEPRPGQRCSGRNYQGRRCCTPEDPCDEGEGDCDGPGDGGGHDGHDGCKGDLQCGSNNCKKFGHYYHEKDDCCEKP